MIERVHNFDVLEKCTKDILSLIKPLENDRNKRLYAIQELQNSIYSVGALRGAAVKPFGSFVSNLYAKSGDLDVSIELWNDSNLPISKKKKQNVLRELRRALQIRGVASYMDFIPNARIPVLQYVSNHFGISCDISVDNYPGRIKSKIFYWINTLDERFGDMVLLVKEWAKAQNINDAKNGTLNSYSLCLLVIYHFQTCEPAILPPLKEIYDGNIAEMAFFNDIHLDEVCEANIARFRRQDMGQRNQRSLSFLLASFFHKFLHIDALSSDVISTYTGRLERIQDNPSWMAKSYSLFVEDPFERSDNAARAVGMNELHRIASAFNDANYTCVSDGLAERKELLSLLCTPDVGSKLVGRAMADRYTNTPTSLQHDRYIGYVEPVAANPHNNQHHQRARGFTGSGPIHSPQGYNSGRLTAGPYQNRYRPQAYTTGLQTAGDYQNLNHPQAYTNTTGRETAGPYQSQQQRKEYTSNRQINRNAVTTRYKPVRGRFHNDSTWDPRSQASSSSTAWNW